MWLLGRAGGRVPVPLLSPSGVKIRARLNAFATAKFTSLFSPRFAIKLNYFAWLDLFCPPHPPASRRGQGRCIN